MSAPVRLLIVGTGGMAKNHAEGFSAIPGVTVVGGVDTRPAQLAAFQEAHGIPHGFASIDDALRWARTLGGIDLLALLPHQGVGATLQELCDPEHGHEAVLNLLNRLLDASWRLSDEVGRLYFAHAEPEDAMVSA